MDQPFRLRAEGHYPPERVAWYVIGILFLLTLFAQLDRQLPALLVGPIRAEFGISDTAFSLAQGYAFAFVFTIVGLPLGRFVDRTNRRNLLFAGILLWSAMTVMAGMVTSYTGFFVARMGVGVGEAVLAPAAYSLIADYVRPERRGRAISVYYLSYAVGQGASLLIGGLLLQAVPEAGLQLPGIGHYEPWRMAFLIAGVPGILLALLLLTVREPVRQEAKTGKGSEGFRISTRAIFAYVRAHGRAFLPLFICPAMAAIVGYAAMNWAPAFFDRRFGFPPTEAGPVLGVMIALVGLVGTLVAGFMGDRWIKKDVPAARLRVMTMAWSIIAATALIWPLVPSLVISIALLGIMMLGLMMALASLPTIVQDIVPNGMRGQIVAAYSLVAGLLGIAIAPTLVALLTDHVFKDEAMVGYSLAIVAGPAGIVGLFACWSGLRPYARAYDEFRSTNRA